LKCEGCKAVFKLTKIADNSCNRGCVVHSNSGPSTPDVLFMTCIIKDNFALNDAALAFIETTNEVSCLGALRVS